VGGGVHREGKRVMKPIHLTETEISVLLGLVQDARVHNSSQVLALVEALLKEQLEMG